MADNEISILVKAEVDKAIKDLDKLKKSSENTKGSFEGMLKELKAGFVALAAVVGGVVIKSIADLTKKGAEFLDLQDDFTKVFEGAAGSAVDMAAKLVESLGTSTEETYKLLSANGALLQSMGFTTDKSLEMASRVTELSVAISRFSAENISAEEASQRLTAALNGREGALRSLNLSIRDNEVKQKAVNMGLAVSTDAVSKQAEAQAILALVTERSSKALEGLDKKNLSLADKMQIANNRFKDFTTAIGVGFAKKLEEVADYADKVKFSMEGIEKATKITLEAIIPLAGTVALILTIPMTQAKNAIEALINSAKHVASAIDLIKTGNLKTGLLELGKSQIELGKAVAAPFTGLFEAVVRNAKQYATSVVNIQKTLNGELEAERKKDDAKKKAENDARISQNKEQGKAATEEEIKAQKKKEEDIASARKRIQQASYLNEFELRANQSQAIMDQELKDLELLIANKQIKDEEYLNRKEATQRAHADRINKINEEAAAMQSNLQIADFQQFVGSWAPRVSFVSNVVAGIQETLAMAQANLAAQYDAGYAKFKEVNEKEKSDLDERLKQGLISQEQYNAAVAEIDGRFSEQNKILKKKQAREEFALRMAQYTMAVAGAFVKIAELTLGFALAGLLMGGGITGGIIGASIGAGIGGAQMALIAANKPVPPPDALATGGLVTGPQLIVAGEKGTEAVLPADLTQLLMDAAGAGGGAGGTINIGQIVANDPVQFSQALDRYVKRNGRILNT